LAEKITNRALNGAAMSEKKNAFSDENSYERYKSPLSIMQATRNGPSQPAAGLDESQLNDYTS